MDIFKHCMHKPGILGGKPRIDSLLPFVRPSLPDYEDIAGEVRQIVATGVLTKGARLEQFEAEAAKALGAKHAVGVSSCTIGLMLAYICLGLDGEVIVPSFTFMATVSSLVLCGLRPVYVDVDLDSGNIDPAAVEAAITPRTSAIVGVHNFGNPAEVEALEAIAQKRGLQLIFDAAHGLGSLRDGRPLGSQGAVHSFSLSPTKLVVAGEGGLVTTDNEELAEKLRIGREYGHSQGYDSAFAGLNGRLGEFNAILGRHSLAMLPDTVDRRNQLARLYYKQLADLPGVGFQRVRPQDRSSYKDFAVTINQEEFGLDRDTLALALRRDNIDTRAYYDPPVHRQTAYRQYAGAEELTRTNLLAQRTLCLPMGAHVSDEVCRQVCQAIRVIQAHASEIIRSAA